MPGTRVFITSLFILCLSTCFPAHAQVPIVDDEIKGTLILAPEHSIQWIDSTNKTSIQEILNKPPKFTRNLLGTGKNEVKNAAYWLKLRFSNNQSQPVSRFVSMGYISLLDVYVTLNNKVIEHQQEGLMRPFSQRKIVGGAHIFFSFKCPANKTVSIYLKMRSVQNNPIWLAPEIMTSPHYLLQKQNNDLYQGIIHGLLWMMLLYSLFMYLSLKDVAYLHYAGYIFCLSVFFLYIQQYIASYIPFFGETPRYSINLGLILYPAFMFYYLLMRHFNNLEQYPKTDWWLAIWIKINIVFFVAALLIININLSLFYILSDLFNALAIVVFGAFQVAVARTGNILSRYFVAGSLCMITGSIVTVSRNFMDIPAYKSTIYFQSGVIFEILVFALGLSVRFRLNQKETRKAQDKLIEQLQHNEELQENYSKELEVTVEERTAELQNAYTNITDSVHYAQRIQQSILVRPHDIGQKFQDFFIFFEPKDIVSGDFYWFAQHNKELIIAAIDCTGHGVPGAFMTIMGNDFLNEIVSSQQITQPAQILSELDKKITSALQKQGKETDINDGMDMAILNINYEINTVQYAGAKNPLWYVSNAKMNIIKASKFPVGSAQYKEEKVFENHLLPLQKDDIFYIFSDGFQDQFGGKNDKKYMKRNFRELLLKLSSLPLNKQQQQLRATFEEWKQHTPQTDDVLVAGIKI